MRKLSFLLAFILVSLCSRAQIHWLLKGGYNYNSAKVEFLDKKRTTTGKSGFNIGIGAKALFDYNLYFTPQFNYSMKGYVVTYGADTTISKSNTTAHFIEIPILLQMYLNPNSVNKIYLQYGPSINCAIAGSEKVTLSNGNTENRKLKFGEVYYGRWEASLMAALGYEVDNRWSISAGLNLGLTNFHNSDFGPNIRTRQFSANFSYYFK